MQKSQQESYDGLVVRKENESKDILDDEFTVKLNLLFSRLNMLGFERESNGNKIFAGKSFDKEEKLDIIKAKLKISKM